MKKKYIVWGTVGLGAVAFTAIPFAQHETARCKSVLSQCSDEEKEAIPDPTDLGAMASFATNTVGATSSPVAVIGAGFKNFYSEELPDGSRLWIHPSFKIQQS